MTDWLREREEKAAANVRDILARPMAEDGMLGCDGTFDPWDIFPSLYGSYSSEFDDCALAVLCDLRDGTHHRDDLASQILKEMLCTSDLCSYGTSPRVCFPNSSFRKMLPDLIAKWRLYVALQWGDVAP